MSKILVTGSAGFIGFHLCRRLLADGHEVLGLDNFNDYYDVGLKEARTRILSESSSFTLHRIDLADSSSVSELFEGEKPSHVVNLAAQAGVRRSLTDPHTYINSNVVGFLHILEGCRYYGVEHLVFASSSSVYGLNTSMPFSVHDNVDHPLSMYAATKRSNELMAHTYAHLYGVPCTGLRFFTVYGPWGRPDMALFLFARSILAGEPISVFNNGDMRRDFTYVDDIVEGVVRALGQPAAGSPAFDAACPDPAISSAPYRVFNIGGSHPVDLMEVVRLLEKELGREATIEYLPMQAGDIRETCADAQDLERVTGFRPQVGIEDGLAAFVAWYREYYEA